MRLDLDKLCVLAPRASEFRTSNSRSPSANEDQSGCLSDRLPVRSLSPTDRSVRSSLMTYPNPCGPLRRAADCGESFGAPLSRNSILRSAGLTERREGGAVRSPLPHPPSPCRSGSAASPFPRPARPAPSFPTKNPENPQNTLLGSGIPRIQTRFSPKARNSHEIRMLASKVRDFGTFSAENASKLDPACQFRVAAGREGCGGPNPTLKKSVRATFRGETRGAGRSGSPVAAWADAGGAQRSST